MSTATKLATALLALSWSMLAQGVDAAMGQGLGQVQGQACSVPPFTEQHVVAGSATWTVDAEGCGLDAALTSGVSATAVAHYARRPDLGNLRMRFRVDLSALAGLNIVQSVQLAAGIAASAEPAAAGDSATARLFQILVLGDISGTQKSLMVVGACAGQPANRCVASSALTTARPTVALDWRSGPAGVGQLRWWIDADFDQAPSGSLALDNLAWGSVERVVLGLASATPGFIANHGGRTVRIDHTEVLEDQLAWHDFEALERNACVISPAAPLVIGAGGTVVSGTTCGGSHALTTLASGSTSANTPEINWRVQIAGIGLAGEGPRPVTMQVSATSDPAIAAFLCERACSPSARCHLVSSGGAVHQAFQPGEYRLVVKSLANQAGFCGNWTVNFVSVLK